jgi:DNA-binding transcriptional MerR regulator
MITVHKRFIVMTANEQGATAMRSLPAEVTYRSGAAARLAGLPAETLRVWERRYGLSATRRSARGQRLYTADQVHHLGLLKQLVDQGHPIGQLAALSADALRALANSGLAAPGPALKPVDVMVVGVGLACRLGASSHDTMLLHVVGSCTRLEMVADQRPGLHADLLLVELAEVDEQAIPMIAAAAAGLQASATVVLYRFCSSATIRALRAQGWLVARVPPEIGEVVNLCRQAVEGQHLLTHQTEPAPPAPRFDEAMLARVTTASNALACECPRHMAELLLTIGSFERYSQQCASRDSADARLHQDLGHAAGQARAILEAALERLLLAEGLTL